jgi:hypothetical protein
VSATRTAPQPAPVPAPAQAPAQAPGTPVRHVSASGLTGKAAAAVRSWLSGTPGKLRIALIAAAAVSVLFGIAAAQGFSEASGAIGRADANTAQLVRLQGIHTNLVRADAAATSSFLQGGLEAADKRQEYLNAMGEASRLITDAARSQPADNEALSALNGAVVGYAGAIEQARANNRQTLPVGAQYLRNASSGLREYALPILDNLVTANQNRVTEEFDGIGRGYVWLSASGLAALVVFGGVGLYLARRTHRYVNVPLAIGGVGILLATIAGSTALSNAGANVDDVRDGPYASTLALAQARIAAYDAKSNESLTLIARGSGAEFETAWKEGSTRVTERLETAVRLSDEDPATASVATLWSSYATVHQEIRRLDDGGQWTPAVNLALSTSSNSASSKFAAFDKESSDLLHSSTETTRADLADAGNTLPLWRWVCIVIGILGALCAWWGVSQRLEEYR